MDNAGKSDLNPTNKELLLEADQALQEKKYTTVRFLTGKVMMDLSASGEEKARAYKIRGWSLNAQGDVAEALNDFRQINGFMPEDLMEYCRTCCALLDVVFLKNMMRPVSPNHPDVMEADRLLRIGRGLLEFPPFKEDGKFTRRGADALLYLTELDGRLKVWQRPSFQRDSWFEPWEPPIWN